MFLFDANWSYPLSCSVPFRSVLLFSLYTVLMRCFPCLIVLSFKFRSWNATESPHSKHVGAKTVVFNHILCHCHSVQNEQQVPFLFWFRWILIDSLLHFYWFAFTLNVIVCHGNPEKHLFWAPIFRKQIDCSWGKWDNGKRFLRWSWMNCLFLTSCYSRMRKIENIRFSRRLCDRYAFFISLIFISFSFAFFLCLATKVFVLACGGSLNRKHNWHFVGFSETNTKS